MSQHGQHRARANERRRLSSPRVLAQGLVLALVVGGTTAFASLHRDVTIGVDGSSVQTQTFGGTVADVLASAGVEVGERDLVLPSLDEAAASHVVVRHARQLTVDVDGRSRAVWTTADSVGEAVDELGLRGDLLLSASRSSGLERGVLRVSTQKTVHVSVDGQLIDAVSTGATVRDALVDVGLVLGEDDEVSVPLNATAVDGLVVVVTRASSTGETTTEALPYETQEVDDPGLAQGTRKVVTQGRAGLRTTTYDVVARAGVVVARTPVTSVITRAPVAQVVHVGTKEVPAVAAAPAVTHVDPGSAQAIAQQMVAARGWGDDQFACLVALWNKESGWRVNASNGSSGAYGIPQALPGSKMASAGADWQTNPATQITWGLGYIAGRYGTPCGAWAHLQSSNWY